MRDLRGLLLPTLLSVSCSGSQPLPPVHGSGVVDVSMIQLLANPDEYNGKTVQVTGFCWLEFEGDALYLHREDFEQGILRNAVWLSLRGDIGPDPHARFNELSGHYVLVQGTFDSKEQGHLGIFGGSLTVERMARIASRTDLARPPEPPRPRDGSR